MRTDLCLRIIFFICILLMVLPIAITSIVLSITHPGICDSTELIGITINQQLLAIGIICLVISNLIIVSTLGLFCNCYVRFFTNMLIMASILFILFAIIICACDLIVIMRNPCDSSSFAPADVFTVYFAMSLLLPFQIALAAGNVLVHILY